MKTQKGSNYMKRTQQQNRRNQLLYMLHPFSRRAEKGENMIHMTGMVWSGGFSAAATSRTQSGIRR